MALFRRRYPDGRISRDWYVSWYVGGKQFKKKIGPNRRAAETFLAQMTARRIQEDVLGIREPKKILFSEFTKKYLEWAEGRKRPYTVADERRMIQEAEKIFTGLVSKITRKEIEDFLSSKLVKAGPARHNRILNVLRVMFRQAVEWGFASQNPAAGIKRLKEPPGRVRFLTEDERTVLLEACTPHLRRIVEIALDTGLRKGELLALRWENLDFKNREIRVERSKNGDRRDVPMSDRVFRVFQGIPRRVDTDLVFTRLKGSPLSQLEREWDKAIEKSKIQDFRFHDLRHTFASNLVMAGVDIRTVQVLMGHKDIRMTQRYSHLSSAHLRAAISALSSSAARTKQEQSATALTGEQAN